MTLNMTRMDAAIDALAQEMVEWAERGWVELAREFAPSSSKIRYQVNMWDAAVDYAGTYAPEHSPSWYVMIVQNTCGFVPYPETMMNAFNDVDLGPDNA